MTTARSCRDRLSKLVGRTYNIDRMSRFRGWSLSPQRTTYLGSVRCWQPRSSLKGDRRTQVKMNHGAALCFIGWLAASAAVRADDWPQWLGPRRDAVWREKDIIERFPK